MYWLTGILGVAMMAAPYVLRYSTNTTALWTSVILGVGVVAVSLFEGAVRGKERWEYWAAGAIGVLAIIAPFVLRFSTHATAMWTTVVAGVLIALAAGYKLLSWE